MEMHVESVSHVIFPAQSVGFGDNMVFASKDMLHKQ